MVRLFAALDSRKLCAWAALGLVAACQSHSAKEYVPTDAGGAGGSAGTTSAGGEAGSSGGSAAAGKSNGGGDAGSGAASGGAAGDVGEAGAGGEAGSCNTDSDPENCGACGHSCLTTACIEGFCEPEVIATGQGSLQWNALALDATHVYWTSGDTVKRRAKSGTPEEPLGPGWSFGLAVDDTDVYWCSVMGGEVLRVAKTGGTPDPIASAQNMPFSIALTADTVFWTDRMAGSLLKVSKSGGLPTPVATSQSAPTAVAVRGDDVFWTNYDSGAIMVRHGGDAPMPHATVTVPAFGLVVDDDGVYVTGGSGSGAVIAIPDGGAPMVLAPANSPRPIAIDDAHVYFGDQGAYVLGKVSKNGGPLLLLAHDQSPEAVAVDDTHVYWTTNLGDVLRVAK